MPKKIKSVKIANTVIEVRDIWALANDSEQYVIGSVSNTLIKGFTIGDWTDQFEKEKGSEYWHVVFTKQGWIYYTEKLGLKKTGVLDPNIKI